MSANPPIRAQDWRGKTIWIVGASTGIGLALAQDLSALGAHLILTARNQTVLEQVQADMQAKAAQLSDGLTRHVVALAADFTDEDGLGKAWKQACAFCQQNSKHPMHADASPDMVIVNAGTYENMPAKRFDLARAKHQINVNLNGPLTVLSYVLPNFIAKQGGHIVLVSSVAGYRTLPKALVYGSSKSALSYMAETLYLELAHKGTAVSVIHPGFVQTPLTAGNDFHMPALQTPQQASAAIIKGLQAGRYDIHFPKRFTLFLKILRFLPQSLYMWIVRKTV